MNHRISIVTVLYNSLDWLILLRESINEFASENVQIIVIDNTEWCGRGADLVTLEFHPEYHHVHMGRNIGHGEGLNVGSYIATSEYTMFLDVDCHFLQKGWENAFVGLMGENDVVAGRGVPQKPIRPACMFMKTEYAKKYDWRATPGYKGHRVTPDGFDVAIRAYYDICRDDNVRLKLIDPIPNRYGTLNGEEFCIGGTPYVYHHWHGTHLKERQVDFQEDLQANKEKLFRQIPWRLASQVI